MVDELARDVVVDVHVRGVAAYVEARIVEERLGVHMGAQQAPQVLLWHVNVLAPVARITVAFEKTLAQLRVVLGLRLGSLHAVQFRAHRLARRWLDKAHRRDALLVGATPIGAAAAFRGGYGTLARSDFPRVGRAPVAVLRVPTRHGLKRKTRESGRGEEKYKRKMRKKGENRGREERARHPCTGGGTKKKEEPRGSHTHVHAHAPPNNKHTRKKKAKRKRHR